MNFVVSICTAGSAGCAIRRVDRRLLDSYSAADRIARLIEAESHSGDEKLTSQRWLSEIPAKRLIYEMLYGDLLDKAGLRILDVGGGLNALTRRLAARHSYELVELMAHDSPERVAVFRASVENLPLSLTDWWSCRFTGSYDVVVANDLFPNVDQRLALFLERMLPISREVRLSLTYYNHPRFYLTRRIDADEILCMLAWNGSQTRAALASFVDPAAGPELAQFDCADDTVFNNGRQVAVISMRGDVVER